MTRVAVVGGGRSSEHDVSLASAGCVAEALSAQGHDVVALTVDRDGRWLDAARAPLGPGVGSSLARAVDELGSVEVVLPVLHGPHGEDGTLAALCDLVGVPCAGSPLRAGALGMDKWATKLVANAVGIATAPGVLVTRRDVGAADAVPLPAVVKPVAAGSSHGVSLVRAPEDLAAALERAFALDDRVLVEQLVVGRELDVAVLERPGRGPLVGPVLEVLVPPGTLFDEARKYDGTARFAIPALLPAQAASELAFAAVRLFDALGCRGVARVDFFWTGDGPVLGEVNTMPGMTLQSQVPRIFAAAGLGLGDLLDALVRSALASSSRPVLPPPTAALAPAPA